MLTTKSRVSRVQTTFQNRWVDTGGVPGSQSPVTTNWYDKQWTASEGHRGPYKNRGNVDIGGPFSTISAKVSFNEQTNQRLALPDVSEFGYWVYHYTGDILPPYLNNEIPATVVNTDRLDGDLLKAVTDTFLPDQSDLVARGASLIAKCAPNNPVAQGSVGLAELFREGIPKMIGHSILKARTEFLKSIGDEYLNYEFGWKPLVSDLRSAARAIMESEKILLQLQRDSGQPIRRSATLPAAYDKTYTSYGSFTPDGPWSNQVTQGEVIVRRETYRRTRFSGCFTYHFDPGTMSNISRIATQARLLYGVEITPEVLWNLAPWSWLVDWVTNVGDVLHNVSVFQNDGLVMPYGYAMDHSFSTVQKSIGPYGAGLNPSRISSVTFRVERKTRIKASPFGFGLIDSSFTTRQWAILAALGITRH